MNFNNHQSLLSVLVNYITVVFITYSCVYFYKSYFGNFPINPYASSAQKATWTF